MQIVIIGAGGHGKVVLDILRAGGRYEPVGFLDADSALAGTMVGGLPVLGAANLLPRLRQQQKVHAAVVAIGDNRTRARYAQLLREQGFELITTVHPSAVVSPTARLGANVVVAAGAVICTEAVVGDSAIINTAAIVDHEVQVGAATHVSPGVCLAGRVSVGPSAFLGIGAQVLPCLSVGEGATVGAGAVVLQDVPAFATAVGVPARVVKVSPPSPDPSPPATEA
jgi:UDP-perosamine 4-acetyltransferase